MADAQPCEHCGGPTTFATELQPTGREPGYRLFYCSACDHHTWTVCPNTGPQLWPETRSER